MPTQTAPNEPQSATDLSSPMTIQIDPLQDQAVVDLLRDHLADMHANSPPESVHALDVAALRAPNITFWSARQGGEIHGCIALKQLDAHSGEIKSMRTRAQSRGRGIATALLQTLLAEARRRGYHSLYLETGSQAFFAPAHGLYRRFGFVACGPFADYGPDPHSCFMRLPLQPELAPTQES